MSLFIHDLTPLLALFHLVPAYLVCFCQAACLFGLFGLLLPFAPLCFSPARNPNSNVGSSTQKKKVKTQLNFRCNTTQFTNGLLNISKSLHPVDCYFTGYSCFDTNLLISHPYSMQRNTTQTTHTPAERVVSLGRGSMAHAQTGYMGCGDVRRPSDNALQRGTGQLEQGPPNGVNSPCTSSSGSLVANATRTAANAGAVRAAPRGCAPLIKPRRRQWW